MELLFIPVVAVVLVGLYVAANRGRVDSSAFAIPTQDPLRSDPTMSSVNDMVEQIALGRLLDDLQTPARLAACVGELQTARQHLAQDFGRQAFPQEGIRHDLDRTFRQNWKTVCDVVEAKYGSPLLYAALARLGYRREIYP